MIISSPPSYLLNFTFLLKKQTKTHYNNNILQTKKSKPHHSIKQTINSELDATPQCLFYQVAPGLQFLVLYCSLWSICTWFLCRVISLNLFVFYMQTFSLSWSICWRWYPFFSGVYFWLLYQKLGAHRYIGFKFRSSIGFYCSICQVFMPIPCCFYHYSFAALLQIWNVKPLLPDLLYCSGLL